MPGALDILKDPNYVNANAATKQAIFNKRVATLPEYRNASPETRAEIRKRFGVTEQAPPPPRQKGTGVAPVDFTLNALNEALIGIPQGAVEMGAFFTDPLVGLIYGEDIKNKAKQNRANFFNDMSRIYSSQPMSVYREVGKTVAPGAAVSRTARLAIPLLQKAPVVGNAFARLAETTASGGIGSGRTAQEVARMTTGQRAVDMAARVAGGGIAGGATAGLSGQDAIEGAAFGAGLPVVGSLLSKLVGKVIDLRSMPKQRAAQLIRDALGKNEEAARMAFAQLSPDDQRLARQVLIEAGIEPRVFMGLGADVERSAPDAVQGVLSRQAAERQARLAQVSGGLNATERRAAAEEAARGVNEVSGPMRETALQNIEQTNKAVLDAQRIANIVRARADELTASGEVPRMRNLEGRSNEQADLMGLYPSFFPEEGALQRTKDIAQNAGNRADAGVSTQVGLRDTGRQMDDFVAELASQGRKPLRAAPLSNLLRRQANAAGVKTSSARQALLKLANKIDAAADANGLLNPYDLYTLRKEASDIVEKYVSSGVQPSTGSKKRAAGLVMQFKTDVDNALGEEFKSYLRTHQQGMEAVNRQELASTAAQLADENSPEFIKLMRGERPKTVETVMGRGTGNYDIVKAFEQDPATYLALKKSADELQTLNRMNELGREGATAAGELMNRERPFLTRAVTRAGLAAAPTARIGADASEMALSEFMRPRVRQELANAFVSGQNMNDIINMYPTNLRMSGALSQVPAEARNAFAQAATRNAYAKPVEIDPETGFPAFDEAGNPLTTVVALDDGTPIPVYLPPSNPTRIKGQRR